MYVTRKQSFPGLTAAIILSIIASSTYKLLYPQVKTGLISNLSYHQMRDISNQ